MTSTLPDLPNLIETERLLIRPHRRGDGRALFEATVESLTESRRWPATMGWALEEQSEEQSEAFCRLCAKDFAARRDFPLLLTDRASGEIVGSSGLHRLDWSVPKLEIGWWVRTGRGGGASSRKARGRSWSSGSPIWARGASSPSRTTRTPRAAGSASASACGSRGCFATSAPSRAGGCVIRGCMRR